MKKVAIIVDHPIRDLGGCVLVANALKNMEQDIEVYLVPMSSQKFDIFAIAPDFVLVNYIRKNNQEFIQKLIAANIKYGLLDTEGGFYGDLGAYEKVLSNDREIYKKLSCNFLWGKKMEEVWNKYDLGCSNDIVGLPRFDFYHESFRGFENNFLPQSILEKKHMVLLNTKVAVANPKYLTVEEEKNLYRQMGLKDNEIEMHYQLGKQSIEENVKLARRIEKETDIGLVLRPHPHENQKTYKDLFEKAGLKKAEVHLNGNITPWISHSIAVIHRHCTTAIEAVIANKPAFSTLWVPTSANAPDAERVSYKCNSFEELKSALDAIEKNPEAAKEFLPSDNDKNEVISKWLSEIDGKSHVRVAKGILNSIGSSKADVKKCREFLYSAYSQRGNLKSQVYNMAWTAGKMGIMRRQLWELEKKRSSKWLKEDKRITEHDANLWVKSIHSNHKFQPVQPEKYHDEYPGNSIIM